MAAQPPSCVFCQIQAGQAPAQVVAEDDLSLCILDTNPFCEGHCLVIPRRHVPWWHDLTPEETMSLFGLARRAAALLMEAFASDFVGMYARGRRIPHTHIFLVPTRSGDVLDGFFNALERFQEAPCGLAELADAEGLARAAQRIAQARQRLEPGGR